MSEGNRAAVQEALELIGFVLQNKLTSKENDYVAGGNVEFAEAEFNSELSVLGGSLNSLEEVALRDPEFTKEGRRVGMLKKFRESYKAATGHSSFYHTRASKISALRKMNELYPDIRRQISACYGIEGSVVPRTVQALSRAGVPEKTYDREKVKEQTLVLQSFLYEHLNGVQIGAPKSYLQLKPVISILDDIVQRAPESSEALRRLSKNISEYTVRRQNMPVEPGTVQDLGELTSKIKHDFPALFGQ